MSMQSLRNRLGYAGGSDKVDRINRQKLRSLIAALGDDYNSRKIKTYNGFECRALININNLKPDYDKQYISVPFAAGLKEGDTFEILDNGTHWMVYLPDLVETAYLRSEIIRCRYNIEIDGEVYWIYFQGPVETDIRWQQKRQKNFNELNLSGTIFVKSTDATNKFFERFKVFKIADHNWEVQAVDRISVPGILEVELQEFFDNKYEEIPEIKPEPPICVEGETIPHIILGKYEVVPNSVVGYTVLKEVYQPGIEWYAEGDGGDVSVEEFEDGKICKVKVGEKVNEFDICYGDFKQHVVVDRSFSIIQGPAEVYPYGTYEYFAPPNMMGRFEVSSHAARILHQSPSYCKIEILASRKGRFELWYDEDETDERFILPIKVLSL